MTTTTTGIEVPRGLQNVIVTETEIGDVRGAEGYFHYRDHNAVNLAQDCTFEQVWYLMLFGQLLDADAPEIQDFTASAAEQRILPGELRDALPMLAKPGSNPLYVLRAALAIIGNTLNLPPMYDCDEKTKLAAAIRFAAVTPTILAAAYRLSQGNQPIDPDPQYTHAADYVRMVTGTPGATKDVAAIETYLILTIDHGFNASTFTSRVIASTGSDMPSCLLGAIGSFLGPLHGGAPSRALQALEDIGDPTNTEDWVREQIQAGERIMGFGHAVYRTHDPRAQLLKELSLGYDDPLVERALRVEAAIERTLRDLKPGRELYANVEFFAGVLMSLAGFDAQMFTPTFCVARVVGWTANILEQTHDRKIIRPIARYVGPEPH